MSVDRNKENENLIRKWMTNVNTKMWRCCQWLTTSQHDVEWEWSFLLSLGLLPKHVRSQWMRSEKRTIIFFSGSGIINFTRDRKPFLVSFLYYGKMIYFYFFYYYFIYYWLYLLVYLHSPTIYPHPEADLYKCIVYSCVGLTDVTGYRRSHVLVNRGHRGGSNHSRGHRLSKWLGICVACRSILWNG